MVGAITPYRVEIVQGNFVSKEQVDALRQGMTRQQVREMLGTPLVTSIFHADRWDYVFTMKRQGVEPQQRRLTVFFTGDRYDRAEGDAMPSESEFVATLDKKKRDAKVPALEASEAQLSRFARPAAPSLTPADAAPAPSPSSYPPLEPAAR
ncbi:MAG: outer membrane protein assembly factor BamE [Ramlibacter sp.]